MILINFDTGIIFVFEITFLSFSWDLMDKGSLVLTVVRAEVTVGIDLAVILKVGWLLESFVGELKS